MKRGFSMLLLLLFVCMSCSERHGHPVDVPAQVAVPDAVVDDDGVVTRFFDAPNAYSIARVGEVSSRPIVTAALAEFDARGYGRRDDCSFVATGTSATAELEVVILAMENESDKSSDAVHLVCISAKDETVVVPLCVSRDLTASRSSFNEPVGRVNIEAFEPYGDWATDFTWDWERWARCVTSGIAAGGTGCLLHCRFVPAAYLNCLGVCTAGHALSSLVLCSIREFSE